jgi:Leucine-rich repeat (LRR) protein
VTDLAPLNNLDGLNEINFSNTQISDLMPLDKMSRLSKIYCDNSLVDKKMTDTFMSSNPNVLVIYETKALELWWNALPSFWKDLLTDQAMTSKRPTKEELHSIINIRNLKVNHFIQDAEPISRLTNIEFLDMSDSKIDDLSPLYGLHNLKSLNVKNTVVSDLSALSNLKNLKELNIENTDVKSLKPLYDLSNLSIIYADGSKINRDEVIGLKKQQRQLTVVYQTDELKMWWGNLDLSWREIFNSHLLCDSNPTAEQLQSIIDIEEVIVNPDNVVYSLEPLRQMAFLKKLIINNNQIQDLTPLSDKEYLEVLSVSGNPVDNIIPLANSHSLKNLNIENTPVSDLTPIASLKNIKVLNIGGTSVRNLKPLADYQSLEDLSIVNTYIKSVVPLENLTSLKHLKAYKTKIKNKHIELLKQKFPDLNVIYY